MGGVLVVARNNASTSLCYSSLPSLGSLYLRAFLGIFKARLLKPGQAFKELSAECKIIAIDPNHVSRFVAVLRDGGPVQGERLLPQFLPVGYLHAVLFPLSMAILTWTEFPLNVLGSVHESQKIVAIAELSDGSFWTANVNVIVTIAACVEDLVQ